MLDSILASGLTLPAFLICTAVSLVLGIATAFLCMYRSKCSQGFAVTVAVLPAIVQIVILLVNGNVGAGVAVAGAFSLGRFRSVPGTAREIGVIFLAMALAGLNLWELVDLAMPMVGGMFIDFFNAVLIAANIGWWT